jgi:hypothetical protein
MREAACERAARAARHTEQPAARVNHPELILDHGGVLDAAWGSHPAAP